MRSKRKVRHFINSRLADTRNIKIWVCSRQDMEFYERPSICKSGIFLRYLKHSKEEILKDGWSKNSPITLLKPTLEMYRYQSLAMHFSDGYIFFFRIQQQIIYECLLDHLHLLMFSKIEDLFVAFVVNIVGLICKLFSKLIRSRWFHTMTQNRK